MNSYSKSVSSLSSARGWKTKDLFFMPNTQAVSGEFANIRPEGQKIYISNMKQGTLTYTFCLCNIFSAFIRPCPHRVCSILSVCQSAIKRTWSPFWWQSFGQMELVFHPNGIDFLLLIYFLLNIPQIRDEQGKDIHMVTYCTCCICPSTFFLQSNTPLPSSVYRLKMKSVL